jgi:Na+/phosphate symporter
VVPILYGRQANWLAVKMSFQNYLNYLIRCKNIVLTILFVVFFVIRFLSFGDALDNRIFIQFSYCLLILSLTLVSAILTSIKNNNNVFNYLNYMVKPHGQLVLVSSTLCNASTPSLSTS